MELRHLRYFLAVAEHGHVGRAAAALHVVKQALSAQVADLERELGVALFVRHPRGMTLTRAGDVFLTYAREALAANARAVAEVHRLVGAGTLRVGLHDFGRGRAIGRRAVAHFRAAYPDVALTLDPAAAAGQPGRVRARALDVGFTFGYAPDGPGADDLAAERLTPEPISHVFLAADHPLAGCDAVAPADLSRYPCVSYGMDAHPRVGADEIERLRAAGWAGRYDVEVDHGNTVPLLAHELRGWFTGPASFLPYLAAEFVGVPLAAGGGTPMDVFVVTRAGDADGADPLVAAFLGGVRAARDELLAGPLPRDAPAGQVPATDALARGTARPGRPGRG